MAHWICVSSGEREFGAWGWSALFSVPGALKLRSDSSSYTALAKARYTQALG